MTDRVRRRPSLAGALLAVVLAALHRAVQRPSAASPAGLGAPTPATPTATGPPGATPSGAAGTPATPSGSPAPTPSAQDLAYLQAAHLDNLAEIQAGTAAEHRASSRAARNLGARLVREHTSLDADLQRVATRLNVVLPTAPATQRQQQLDQLTARSGVAFDRAWVTLVTDWNNQAVGLHQDELRLGVLTEIKDLARDALPVARGHLSRLQQIPTDGPDRPSPARTSAEDYSATQSPLVVSVAVIMIVLGVALLALAIHAALRARPTR